MENKFTPLYRKNTVQRSSLRSTGNEISVDELTKEISQSIGQPKDLVEDEIRQTIRRAIIYGFIGKKRRNSFSGQDNIEQIDGPKRRRISFSREPANRSSFNYEVDSAPLPNFKLHAHSSNTIKNIPKIRSDGKTDSRINFQKLKSSIYSKHESSVSSSSEDEPQRNSFISLKKQEQQSSTSSCSEDEDEDELQPMSLFSLMRQQRR